MDYAEIFLFLNGFCAGLTVGLVAMVWSGRN